MRERHNNPTLQPITLRDALVQRDAALTYARELMLQRDRMEMERNMFRSRNDRTRRTLIMTNEQLTDLQREHNMLRDESIALGDENIDLAHDNRRLNAENDQLQAQLEAAQEEAQWYRNMQMGARTWAEREQDTPLRAGESPVFGTQVFSSQVPEHIEVIPPLRLTPSVVELESHSDEYQMGGMGFHRPIQPPSSPSSEESAESEDMLWQERVQEERARRQLREMDAPGH